MHVVAERTASRLALPIQDEDEAWSCRQHRSCSDIGVVASLDSPPFGLDGDNRGYAKPRTTRLPLASRCFPRLCAANVSLAPAKHLDATNGPSQRAKEAVIKVPEMGLEEDRKKVSYTT